MAGRGRFAGVRAAGLGVLAVALLSAPVAPAEHHPASRREDVEVMRRGGIIMYRYRDANGQVVVVDTPPPFYFDTDDSIAAPARAARDVAAPAAAAAPATPRAPRRPAWWGPAWALPLLLALASVVVALRPRLRRWRRESPLDRAIRQSAMPVFEELKLAPDGRNPVVAERVVRTPSTILVVVVAELSGDVRGALDADHWIVGNRPVLNPLRRLAQAQAAVTHYVLDVPVEGRLIVQGAPKFAMPLPRKVQSVATFAASLPEFAAPELPWRKLDTAWRTLMRHPHSNAQAARPPGRGPGNWLRRHAVAVLAGVLAFAAVTASVALLGVAPVS